MIIIFSVQKEKIHSALSMAEERTGEKKISHRCNNSKILQVSFCMTLVCDECWSFSGSKSQLNW